MNHFSHVLSEEDVKRKLKIDDFRHLSKDKVIEFVSYLDKMDPEVAKKALEQTPELALTAREAIVNIQKVIDKGLESNKESVNSFYCFANENVNVLREELNKEYLSDNEREKIIQLLYEITKMLYDKDTENKKFLSDQNKIIISGAIALVTFVSVSLGATVVIGKPLLSRISK